MKSIIVAIIATAFSFGAMAQASAPSTMASAPMAKTDGMKKDTATPMKKAKKAKKAKPAASKPAA